MYEQFQEEQIPCRFFDAICVQYATATLHPLYVLNIIGILAHKPLFTKVITSHAAGPPPSLYERLRHLVHTSPYIDPDYVLTKLPPGKFVDFVCLLSDTHVLPPGKIVDFVC
jgi:hypothetical protein